MSVNRRVFLITTLSSLALFGHKNTYASRRDIMEKDFHALGAQGKLILPQGQASEDLYKRITNRLMYLESIFSLYQENSQLNQLNHQAILSAPASELLAVLNASRDLYTRTEGLFDPTIQTLHDIYADTNMTQDQRQMAAQKAVIGFDKVVFSPESVRLAAGIKVSLNGIAPGYITDQIAEILDAAGHSDYLVNIGEYYARGRHPDGHPWHIVRRNGGSTQSTTLSNQGMAVSHTSEILIAGQYSHIFNPLTRRPAGLNRHVMMTNQSAMLADGLTTARAAGGRVKRHRHPFRKPSLSI